MPSFDRIGIDQIPFKLDSNHIVLGYLEKMSFLVTHPYSEFLLLNLVMMRKLS